MNNPKFQLVQDDAVVSMKGRSVRTANGLEIPADIVVLSTGFRISDYFFPLKVTARGEELVSRLKASDARMYRGAFGLRLEGVEEKSHHLLFFNRHVCRRVPQPRHPPRSQHRHWTLECYFYVGGADHVSCVSSSYTSTL